MRLAWPFHIDERGTTAEASHEDYVRQLIELLLLTDPGERVMRPDLGGGVRSLLFAPLGGELLGSTGALVRGNLERWLGALIEVLDVDVSTNESVVVVRVQYRLRRDGTEGVVAIEQGP